MYNDVYNIYTKTEYVQIYSDKFCKVRTNSISANLIADMSNNSKWGTTPILDFHG